MFNPNDIIPKEKKLSKQRTSLIIKDYNLQRRYANELDRKMPDGYEYHVYVIECENSKYYVGVTGNIERRLSEHFGGYGAHFTKKHKPIKVIEKIYTGTCKYRACEIERETTEKYKFKYGNKNVGGAPSKFHRNKIQENQRELSEKEIQDLLFSF
jgi:predicted GIY-YIG superfamily endonuclease